MRVRPPQRLAEHEINSRRPSSRTNDAEPADSPSQIVDSRHGSAFAAITCGSRVVIRFN